MLKAYYLQLRAASAADPGALPVTARQLESLVRLSEARARAELREEVTREDAEVGGWVVGHVEHAEWVERVRGVGGFIRGCIVGRWVGLVWHAWMLL